MNWCDSSVINWDAVSAIGTWVIGIAAVMVAWWANTIAVSLRQLQTEREETSARVMLTGLRIEVKEYAKRLNKLVDLLCALKDKPGDNPTASAHLAFSVMAKVGFSDFAHRSAAVQTLPKEIGEAISWIYSRERINRALFMSNAELFEKYQREPSLTPQDTVRLTRIFERASRELDTEAQKFGAVATSIARHLGIQDVE